MFTVYKYPLPHKRRIVQLPKGAHVLTVQMQDELPYLWAKVDPTQPLESRIFHIYGTGQSIPDYSVLAYVATFQEHGGALVWHVFEELKAG